MNDLADRATKMLRNGEPVRLVGAARSIQFLRGVFSRASMCIPAFYYFLGSASASETARTTSDNPFKIAQAYSEFCDLNTLTLACRKIFDHAAKPDLTGANFGKTSDQVLLDHAKHWAKHSEREVDECESALVFLRSFFAEYSRSDSVLLKKDGFLHKRIGLMKQHADRAAAHLSLEDYSLDLTDLAHFTASVAMVAEIVRSFDNPWAGDNYFNRVDEEACAAAKRIFPQITDFRLFRDMQVHQQARFYWKHQEHESVQSYFDRLQWVLG